MRALLLTGLVGLSLLSSARAVVRRDDVSDRFYRQLGNLKAFASVGRVEVNYGSRFQPLGTATLLPGGRLISAGHVFDDSALNGAVGLRVRFGNQIANIDLNARGTINIHPRYNPRNLRNDIAVIFLDQPIQLRAAQVLTGPRVSLGREITFVGYGNTGTGLTGQRILSSTKRAGENILDRYYNGKRRFEIDFDNPSDPGSNALGAARATAFEALLGSGDSGGSVWVRDRRRWRLMGINSYGRDTRFSTFRDSDYGDISGFINVPAYERWIDSLSDPFASSSFATHATLAAVPEPHSWLLLALGGASALLAARGARRRPKAVPQPIE